MTQSPATTVELDFWTHQLAGANLVLELPTDHARPPVQSNRRAQVSVEVPEHLCGALAQLSRCEETTLFLTLLAAFQVLLHRYSGQDDIIVGTPARIESATILLRGNLAGNPPFRQFLRQIRAAAVGAFAHQNIPFEPLAEALQPVRDTSRSPLCQVLFALQDSPVTTGTAKFDLTMELTTAGSGLAGNLNYAADLFDESRMQRMVGHFMRLLAGVVANPDQCLGELPLLTSAEQEQVLIGWNDTATPVPAVGVAELFAAQVQQTPDAVALVFGDQQLTYRELAGQAERLAAYLHGQGVGPEKLVGLNIERSLEMVVALVAVAKTGGAYLPLDPMFPADRLAFMIEDAKPVVVLTRETVQAAVRANTCPTVPALPTMPDNLAYVLYTSGSTGKPKGVQISQRALVNFLTSFQREPGLTAHDVLLAVTTLSFDIAGLELWLPLITGARVVIADRATVTDGAALARLLGISGATVMQATPATWRMLIQAGWSGTPGLKILCGGEALPADLAEQLLARGGAVWNLYGPTETTVWSAVSRVWPGQPVVIGRPLANTTFYVVDRHWQPVPVGVPGELLIGGAGLARGYLNRPELTAEKFVAHPFRAGARLYRTGDLMRYRADGTLEFLGRLDHQVKVRGFRIELGEIEAALRDAPEVRDVVVIAREDVPGDKQLVAYLLSHDGQLPAAELRGRLRAKLPEYMVPAEFVTLARFPLTPNGKVDRRALPMPAPPAPQLQAPPRTALERTLARVWQEVLHVGAVGVEDNFFDVGGDSLRLIRIQQQLQLIVQRKVSVTDLFKYPTIRALAGFLGEPTARPASWLRRVASRAQQMKEKAL